MRNNVKAIVSILVIALMVGGIFGIAVNIGSTASVQKDSNVETRADVVHISGTYVINENTIDPLTGEQGKYGFDASVVVDPTGTLIVENATIYFLSDETHRYNLTVYGNLTLYNARLTIGDGLLHPYFPFSINIIGGQSNGEIKIVNSTLAYPGWFNVTDKTDGRVYIFNSTFKKMNYPDEASSLDGPTPYFNNSVAYIMGSSFMDIAGYASTGPDSVGMIQNTSGGTITSADTSNLVFQNYVENPLPGLYEPYWNFTLLQFDLYAPYTNTTGYDGSSRLVMVNQNTGEEYLNVTVTKQQSGSGAVEGTYTFSAPYGFTPNSFYQALQNGDVVIYVTVPNTGAVTFNNVDVTVRIEGNIVHYGYSKFFFNVVHSTLYMRDTYVDVDYGNYSEIGSVSNKFYLDKLSAVYALNLTVNMDYTPPDPLLKDNCFWIADSSEAYILRYADTSVVFQGIRPIPGLNVSAEPNTGDINSDPALISKMVTIMNTYITATSTVERMKLANITGNTVWDITDKNGRALLPLLTDIVNRTEMPNSKFVGIYNLSVHNDTKSFYQKNIGLEPFPNLYYQNNTNFVYVNLTKYKDINLQIDTLNILTQQPYVPNRAMSILVNVTNNGTDVADNVLIYVMINDMVVDTLSVPSINGGATYTTTYTIPSSYFPSSGIYNISVAAYQDWDYMTSNNIAYVEVPVGSISVTSWNVGNVIRYHTVDVGMNINSVYAWNNVNVGLYLDDNTTLLNSTTMDLMAGNNPVVFGWDVGAIPPGTHTLLAYVNGDILIGSYMISVGRDVDLETLSVTVQTPEPYVPGRSMDIEISVTNHGNDDALNVTLSIKVNGNTVDTLSVPSINGGATYTTTYTIPSSYFPSSGIYNISVAAYQDWDYMTSNNIAYVEVPVGSISVTSWNVGNVIRYHTVDVGMNINSVYAWNNVNVGLYLDDLSNPINSTVVNLVSGNTAVIIGWDVGNTPAGTHMILAYINGNIFLGSMTVTVEMDVDLEASALDVSPQETYVESTVTITGTVVNLGSEAPTDATVYLAVYDPYNYIVSNQSFQYSPTQGNYQTTFTPTMSGTYRVVLTVIATGDYNRNNNVIKAPLIVHPTPYRVHINVENEYVNGTDIHFTVDVDSEVNAALNVNIRIAQWGVVISPSNPENPMDIGAGGTLTVEFVIPQSVYQPHLQGHSYINLNFDVEISSNVTGNAVYTFSAPTVIIREKANFAITSFTISFNEEEVTSVPEGVVLSVDFSAINRGGVSGSLEYVILDNGNVVYSGNGGNLNPGETVHVLWNYTIYGVGTHNITLVLNPNGTVDESTIGDNIMQRTIEVTVPAISVSVTSYSAEHGNTVYVGDTLVVTVKVINLNATESQGKTVYLRNATITLTLGNLGTFTGTTNEYGMVSFNVKVNRAGTYTPQVTVGYGGTEETYTPQGQSISAQEPPKEIPWLWIIIAIIAAAIAGFLLYGFITFRKEAQEYMVCGNCGHLVPADAEKCPYCGVIFEKEKVKCPECGSWIDEDSKFCPVCGTIFMPKEDPEHDKYEKYKENYEMYLAKYREEAKKYIGEEYTNEEFYKWWKTHPEFISFLEWIKRQEEEISGDTVECPVCGASNPKGAKICRVCGSPLPQEGEEIKEEEIKIPELDEETMKKYREEYEKLKSPGVVSFEEWLRRKEAEEAEEKKEETEEEGTEGAVEEEKPEETPEEAPPAEEKKVTEEAEETPEIEEAEEKKETEEAEETTEEGKRRKKPRIRKKVIKKVIAVDEKEKKD